MTLEIAPATDYWLEVGHKDFLAMVKSLKLGKGQGTRFRFDSSVQIAMLGDEAIFAMSGAERRLKARGHWPGHSTCSYQTLASFLKIPPPLGDVIIRYANDRLFISTLQVTARWVSKRATPVAENEATAPARIRARACPECGKQQGYAQINVDWNAFLALAENNPVAHTINELNRFSAMPRITALACRKCEYRWLEFQQTKRAASGESSTKA